MTYQDDDFILVGNFGRPIGLKGSIKLNSFTRPPENIKSYNSFFMKENSQFAELEVKENRQADYPSIADQLDDIYHNGIDGWKATIKTTKDKYPKPS